MHRRSIVFGLTASVIAVLAGTFAGPVNASGPIAWAVGDYHSGSTQRSLIEFWNGSAWTIQTAPTAGSEDFLAGVAVTSFFNAWAVGGDLKGGSDRTFILRWNGFSWTRQTTPNVGNQDNRLSAVSASSATNAWAVGVYDGPTSYQTLILHWNGSSWSRQSSPSPGAGFNSLTSVVAISATNAWAFGSYGPVSGSKSHALILHWNGTHWKRVSSPSSGSHDELWGADATSRSNIWAVGDYLDGATFKTLTFHRNGSAWSVIPSPNSSADDDGSYLADVTVTSSTNAWAVGQGRFFHNGGDEQFTRILHWNGSKWSLQTAPQRGTSHENVPNAIAASSASNAWIVGYWAGSSRLRTLILHWDGISWTAQSSPNLGTDENTLADVAVAPN